MLIYEWCSGRNACIGSGAYVWWLSWGWLRLCCVLRLISFSDILFLGVLYYCLVLLSLLHAYASMHACTSHQPQSLCLSCSFHTSHQIKSNAWSPIQLLIYLTFQYNYTNSNQINNQ